MQWLLDPAPSRVFRITFFICLLLRLATSTPVPSNTTELHAALPDRPIVADTCPTPPTQFLPYAPPPGYTPAPGCPPANTQPSESNPPAGVYGSGSGSGSSGSSSETVYSSTASGRKGEVAIVSMVGMTWGFLLCWG